VRTTLLVSFTVAVISPIRLPPDRGLADKRRSGVKGQKVRLTYAFTSNADGSEKLKPFIIGKAKKPRAFGKKTGPQLGFYYRNNAKAWMTASVYQEWIREWDQTLRITNRKVLLLQDNFSGHIVPDGLQNIRVENFAPNLTAHIQPMDQGIIRCFKAHYRSRYIQRAIHRYDEGTTASDIYDINQLQAMRLAEAAWYNVDTTMIRNCWQKAGILPSMTTQPRPTPSVPVSFLIHNVPHHEDPVLDAKKKVEAALDNLELIGVLRKSNRMGVEALLNPIEESQVLDETSDEDICRAVLNARRAQENSQGNGGDDDADDDAEPEEIPSHQEVLRAVSIIDGYVAGVDDPIARKMEGLLHFFRKQLHFEAERNMIATSITDYFECV
jgi:DDE superfamily endonuclease